MYTCDCGVVALWHIMVTDEKGERKFGHRSYACCSRHLLRAMNALTGRQEVTNLKVVQVNRKR